MGQGRIPHPRAPWALGTGIRKRRRRKAERRGAPLQTHTVVPKRPRTRCHGATRHRSATGEFISPHPCAETHRASGAAASLLAATEETAVPCWPRSYRRPCWSTRAISGGRDSQRVRSKEYGVPMQRAFMARGSRTHQSRTRTHLLRRQRAHGS